MQGSLGTYFFWLETKVEVNMLVLVLKFPTLTLFKVRFFLSDKLTNSTKCVNFGPKCSPEVQNVPPSVMVVIAAFRDSETLWISPPYEVFEF